MKKLLILALYLAIVASANNITYSVISLTGNTQTMGVVVDNQVYPLFPSEKTTLLHTGDAPIAVDGYSYAVLKNSTVLDPENFTRPSVNTDTVNEYYNRSWNKWELDKLPIVLPPLPIAHRIESDLHIDGQIPTIHFIGNKTELEIMHANQTNKEIKVPINMTYISLTDVKNFDNVILQISGHSTRRLPKLSYKIKIDKGDDLFGYRRLKLRSMGTDPSYMRDFLAYDMYNSVGLPTSKNSFVRIYINDEPIGLFGLAEVFKNPWIRNEFANGNKKFKQGAFYIATVSGGPRGPGGPGRPGEPGKPDGPGGPGEPRRRGPGLRVGGADLSYLGNNVSLYSQGYYDVKEPPSKGKANFTRLMEVSRFINEASNTTTDNSAVPLWEKMVDVDSFLRGLAMEILISNSDGYFTMSNNYLLYDDLETERLVFSGSDFDLTLGHTMFNEAAMNGGNYSEFPGFAIRPLTKMLNVPKFKEEFEELLVNITQNLINPRVLSPRIDQLKKMLVMDVEWDKTCPRKNPSKSNNGPNMVSDISFEEAVDGPIEKQGLLGIKEWANLHSKNILDFFYQPSTLENKQSEEKDYFSSIPYSSNGYEYQETDNQKVFKILKKSLN